MFYLKYCTCPSDCNSPRPVIQSRPQLSPFLSPTYSLVSSHWILPELLHTNAKMRFQFNMVFLLYGLLIPWIKSSSGTIIALGKAAHQPQPESARRAGVVGARDSFSVKMIRSSLPRQWRMEAVAVLSTLEAGKLKKQRCGLSKLLWVEHPGLGRWLQVILSLLCGASGVPGRLDLAPSSLRQRGTAKFCFCRGRQASYSFIQSDFFAIWQS